MRAAMRSRREARATWGAWGASVCSRRSATQSNDILSHKIPCRFQRVSEFVFGTHNAAFVQVMYEEYLRDPSSVAPEWRELFDNGKMVELPVIPSEREEVLSGGGMRDAGSVPAPTPTHPASPIPHPGLTPITGPAARLAQNMTDSLSVPTATSFREVAVDTLDARRKELNAQLAQSGKKISF